mgnify:CR=1 FL=1
MTAAGVLTGLGRGVEVAAECVGEAVGYVRDAVDGDARRDLAWMPLLALASVGPRFPAPKALADDGHRPVVFVHGLAGYRGNFAPMRAWFSLHGRTRTYALGLPAGTLLEQADVLVRYLADVAAVNGLGAGQVDLVGHSAGGVVSRLALRDPATAARVHTLVTLGTPHGGTWAARFAGGRISSALRTDSAVIARLEADVPWRKRTRLVCFWSPSDPLMQPAETARVEGADNREIAGFSHLDWVMRRAAWMAVERTLAE